MSKTLTPAEAIEAAARALYGHSIRREATVDERVLTWDELDLYAHLRWFGDAGAALLAVGYVGLLTEADAAQMEFADLLIAHDALLARIKAL